MCGIVGYIGDKEATGIIVEGLRKLEYRGYDSAGIATILKGKTQMRRAVGKLGNLEPVLKDQPLAGPIGIGHTRWATHGGRPKKTRTRTSTAPDGSPSFTTGSSRTISP